MYSATFAMIATIVIAITNLFLGFATAMLMGRGPKRWSDIDRAIVLQPVSLGRLRPAPRPEVERVDLRFQAAPAPCEPEPVIPEQTTSAVDTANDPAPEVPVSETAPESEPPAPEPAEAAPKKLVLPSRIPVDESENDPPEKTLSQQLDAWRHGELADESPSISGLKIRIEDHERDVSDVLADAIYERIKGQVRKDRRVLRIGQDQFAWFSSDVPPDDALMPVERIRQILVKTRFMHQGDPVNIIVVGGAVIGRSDDDAAALLDRLNAALQRAMGEDQHSSCLDSGFGPEVVEPLQFDVEEIECKL